MEEKSIYIYRLFSRSIFKILSTIKTDHVESVDLTAT